MPRPNARKVVDPNVERLQFKRFYMVDQDTALKIARGDIDLTKTEWRVWNILLHHAESGNYVYHTRPFMAEEISMTPTSFHAAIRSLYAKDLLAYCPDRGRGKSIMLSPFHTWRGGSAEQHMARRQYINHRKIKQT